VALRVNWVGESGVGRKGMTHDDIRNIHDRRTKGSLVSPDDRDIASGVGECILTSL